MPTSTLQKLERCVSSWGNYNLGYRTEPYLGSPGAYKISSGQFCVGAEYRLEPGENTDALP